MEEVFGMGAPPIGSTKEMVDRARMQLENPVTQPGQPLPRIADPRVPERIPHGPTQTAQMAPGTSIIGTPEKFSRRTVTRR